jgi:hypothetical protein
MKRKVVTLDPGDRFRWCGRDVKVIDVLPPRSALQRPSLVLDVLELDNRQRHELHYYNDERVEVEP